MDIHYRKKLYNKLELGSDDYLGSNHKNAFSAYNMIVYIIKKLNLSFRRKRDS